MRTTNAVITAGGLLALLLLIAAVWAADSSTPAQLAMTGILILVAVGLYAGLAPREADHAQAGDAAQRERMRDDVP